MIIPLTYKRRQTTATQVGNIRIGSEYPIRIQTMVNTSTNDIETSIRQAQRCIQAGAELLRFTTQGLREVESLKQIHQAVHTIPLVADVHFQAAVADAAACVVEKVRINPGNYIDPARKFLHIDYTESTYQQELERLKQRFSHLLSICRQHHCAIRLGVNHGSLSDRIMSRYGDTPQGMVESVMEFLRIAVEQQFYDIVISIKASNTRIMVTTVRLLVRQMEKENMAFPLHLGVTEAGEGEDGRIKSAVGIGALLADGIGDTIRVSLSEDPEKEIPVAIALRDYFASTDSVRYNGHLSVEIDDSDPVLHLYSDESNWEQFALHAAAESGRLLWDKGCNQLALHNPHFTSARLHNLTQDILQAAGIKRYKTEFISCPGCGRTMFDLEKTVAEVKNILSTGPDLPHYKIAVMGCIVNGPGEMADADYGYVGAGRGKVSLYKGKECVCKNIDQEIAAQELLNYIRHDQAANPLENKSTL